MWNHLKLTAFWWLNDMDLLRGALLWKGGRRRGALSFTSAAATTTHTHTSDANCSVAHLNSITPFIRDLWFVRGITPLPLPNSQAARCSSPRVLSNPLVSFIFCPQPSLSDPARPQLKQLPVEASSTYTVDHYLLLRRFIPPDRIWFWGGVSGGGRLGASEVRHPTAHPHLVIRKTPKREKICRPCFHSAARRRELTLCEVCGGEQQLPQNPPSNLNPGKENSGKK